MTRAEIETKYDELVDLVRALTDIEAHLSGLQSTLASATLAGPEAISALLSEALETYTPLVPSVPTLPSDELTIRTNELFARRVPAYLPEITVDLSAVNNLVDAANAAIEGAKATALGLAPNSLTTLRSSVTTTLEAIPTQPLLDRLAPLRAQLLDLLFELKFQATAELENFGSATATSPLGAP